MLFFNFIFNFKKEKDPRAISSAREKERAKYYRKAILHHQYGNQEEAIKFYTKSIEISSFYAAVYLNRGISFMIQERYLEAYDDFQVVLDLEKKGLSLDLSNMSPKAMEFMEKIFLFVLFEKERGEKIRDSLTSNGLEYFAIQWADILFKKFLNSDLKATNQLIYEELKELEERGGIYREYAINCNLNNAQFVYLDKQFDTEEAFEAFKCMLCCFSRDPNKMFLIRTIIINKLMVVSKFQSNHTKYIALNYRTGMHISNASVDIMFIIKNGNVIYINEDVDQLYYLSRKGDLKLNGKVVNFVYKTKIETIEIFAAFCEEDSCMMFTLNIGKEDRLNYVAQEIYDFVHQNRVLNIFSSAEPYKCHYQYTFKLYKKAHQYHMINSSKTQAYLITKDSYKNDNVNEIVNRFWERE